MKSLDFRKVKKQYLTLTLADDNETTLMIGTPTKRVMDDLIALENGLEELKSNETNTDVMDELYSVCAKIMSRNKDGIEITAEYLASIFDVEDIIIFFNAYLDFVNEIANSKN